MMEMRESIRMFVLPATEVLKMPQNGLLYPQADVYECLVDRVAAEVYQ